MKCNFGKSILLYQKGDKMLHKNKGERTAEQIFNELDELFRKGDRKGAVELLFDWFAEQSERPPELVSREFEEQLSNRDVKFKTWLALVVEDLRDMYKQIERDDDEIKDLVSSIIGRFANNPTKEEAAIAVESLVKVTSSFIEATKDDEETMELVVWAIAENTADAMHKAMGINLNEEQSMFAVEMFASSIICVIQLAKNEGDLEGGLRSVFKVVPYNIMKSLLGGRRE